MAIPKKLNSFLFRFRSHSHITEVGSDKRQTDHTAAYDIKLINYNEGFQLNSNPVRINFSMRFLFFYGAFQFKKTRKNTNVSKKQEPHTEIYSNGSFNLIGNLY